MRGPVSRNFHSRRKFRFRAKKNHVNSFWGLLPESHGQHLALTVFVLHVPSLFDSGTTPYVSRKWPCVDISLKGGGRPPYLLPYSTAQEATVH